MNLRFGQVHIRAGQEFCLSNQNCPKCFQALRQGLSTVVLLLVTKNFDIFYSETLYASSNYLFRGLGGDFKTGSRSWQSISYAKENICFVCAFRFVGDTLTETLIFSFELFSHRFPTVLIKVSHVEDGVFFVSSTSSMCATHLKNRNLLNVLFYRWLFQSIVWRFRDGKRYCLRLSLVSWSSYRRRYSSFDNRNTLCRHRIKEEIKLFCEICA